jgi:phospholipase/carboxylesterase
VPTGSDSTQSEGSQPWRHTRKEIGELRCNLIVPVHRPATHLVTLCHGFGAPGDDLLGMVPWFLEEMQDRFPDVAPIWLVPAAPLSLEEDGMPGGRAWWRLSVQSLIDSFATGKYDVLKQHVPEGIDAARNKLTTAIELTQQEYNITPQRTIVAGFSQGAMISVDTALRGLSEPPGGLWLYSGLLICESIWRPLASRLHSTSIVQSHGTQDPILPIAGGKWLRDMLTEQGNRVDFVSFVGPHTIPPEAIDASLRSLKNIF